MSDMNLIREDIQKAKNNLVTAFVWENSKEGHRYWSDVYDKLEYYLELAEDEYNV